MVTTFYGGKERGKDKRKVVMYARVSTPAGESLAVQKKAVDEYIKRHRLAPLQPRNIYVDRGPSRNLKRPSLSKLRASISKGSIGTVIIWRMDRLTRSMRDLISIMDLFRAHNVTLCVAQDNTCYPVGFMACIQKILQAFSEFEKLVRRERFLTAKQKPKLNC